MKWFTQFIDYMFYHLHREKEVERLYNIVNIEVLFSAWHRTIHEYKVKDRKILRIFENDIDDFIFKIDFYNFLWLSSDIQDELIEKYQYNTKRFEKKRKKYFNKMIKRFWFFDLIIKIFK